MAGMDFHGCPRCELRFPNLPELQDHLARDHGVVIGEADLPEAPSPHAVRGTVLAPVDPARAPTDALDVAASVATQASLGVEIFAAALPGLPGTATDAYLRERQREVLAAGVPSVTWHSFEAGPAAAAIVAHAGATAPVLLCMATRSRGAVGELVLGSVSEEVLRHSPVPVLLVGPDAKPATGRFDRVLVALDGSEHAEVALDAAVGLAGLLGAELFLVEVLDPGVVVGDVFETAHLHRVADALSVPVNYDALHDRQAGRAIVDKAREREGTIVAIGTHGRSGLQRLVMGSVALDVVRHAPCPVLVVPATAAASGLVEPGRTASETGSATGS